MAFTRTATPAEVLATFDWAVRSGLRVSYRHFTHERSCPRAEHGVKHVTHTASKIVVKDGVPFVRYMGELVELTGTFWKSDVRGEECSFVCDIRVKSEYLPTNV